MPGLEPTLTHYLLLAAALLVISLVGIIANRRNVLVLLMAVELVLLSANLNFVAFSAYYNDLSGQVMAMFVLATVAVESAVGLALLILLFRRRGNIAIQTLDVMKG
ncbi:MAG: NADH-quinone oxidoreductase subunit NuoK [Burkholderiales bacterium]|jgi:NADH-quinone oxidoreductase subunit K|nr:NADH-quinone oxidoreductase subunit NuoK [Burkholderiales bacterium]